MESTQGGDPGAQCTCAIQCPDYAHCICIYNQETGFCRVLCNDDAKGLKMLAMDSSGDQVDVALVVKAPLSARVNLAMRDAALGDAARLLAEFADAEIYAPAHQLDERRDMYLEDVSLDTVIRELKLMAVVR